MTAMLGCCVDTSDTCAGLGFAALIEDQGTLSAPQKPAGGNLQVPIVELEHP